MDKWVGKVALVTGASVGIGCAIVDKLVKQGVNVVGCARNTTKLQQIAAKLKNEKGTFCPLQCDLRDEKNIVSMFKFIKDKFGVLHICVNNAGLAHKDSLLDGTTEVSLRPYASMQCSLVNACANELELSAYIRPLIFNYFQWLTVRNQQTNFDDLEDQVRLRKLS